MDLFRINVDASVLNKLKGLGDKTKKKIRNRVDDLTITCIRSFQSAVPIDTGELRNVHIVSDDYQEPSTGAYSARVYVDSDTHHGNRGRSIPASELARILQDGHSNSKTSTRGLRRSRASQPEPDNYANFPSIPARSDTAGWVDKGQKQFLRVYKRVLSGR